MKKPFLLLLSFIPLLASCDNSGTFPNPFPDDKYTKIGFKIDESNEKITRPLTTDETNIVLDTITEMSNTNDRIYSMSGSRETRNYARAFAGEFKQGYNVSNVMKSESYGIARQDEGNNPSTTMTDRRRTRVHNKSTTISQYSYGQIQEEVTQDDYYYFAAEKTQETDATVESTDVTNSISMNLRSKKIENDKYVTITDTTKIIKNTSYNEDELKAYLNLDESKYVFTPDLKCGANASGEIILTSAVQSKHIDTLTGEEGVYSLQDGRKYQAMDNSLTVSKLSTVETTEKKKWCLVDYVRVYTETVITSEVIQPNVSVTKLKNPITISYSEEINHFYETKVSIDDKIPGDA